MAVSADLIDAAVRACQDAGLTPVIDHFEPRYPGDVVVYVSSVESVPGTMGHPRFERSLRSEVPGPHQPGHPDFEPQPFDRYRPLPGVDA